MVVAVLNVALDPLDMLTAASVLILFFFHCIVPFCSSDCGIEAISHKSDGAFLCSVALTPRSLVCPL